MKKPKIVVIGAGSASFGLSTLAGLLRTPELRGSELRLVDVNPEGLCLVAGLARRINTEWGADFSVAHDTDRKALLPGADFVILSIAIDREECWKRDKELAEARGIRHYAENGGPGAFIHGARNLAMVMPILRDMERLCPDAWLLNFTNPVPRICFAAKRYSSVKAVGICHQIGFGYMIAAVVLAKDLGIEVPDNFLFRWDDIFSRDLSGRITRDAYEKLDILAAGLNHFTWVLSLRSRGGEDLYPLFRKRYDEHHRRFEPLTKALHDLYGMLPVPGDCHVCEYLPYTHVRERNTWDRYEIQMYPLALAARRREAMWKSIQDMVAGRQSVDSLREAETERAELIIASMTGNGYSHEPAMNITNNGCIPNLPNDAIVEVPATVCADGVLGTNVGPLPFAIAELCRRQIAVAELSVKAAVEGDRTAALQALALDPMINDPETPAGLLDDYLDANGGYLPQSGDPLREK